MFSFGSGPGMLISQTSLTSGNDLHTVIFGHNNTEGFLQVNSETEQTTKSLGTHANLNSNSALYVGGTDLQPSSIPSEIPFSQQFIGMLSIGLSFPYNVSIKTGKGILHWLLCG